MSYAAIIPYITPVIDIDFHYQLIYLKFCALQLESRKGVLFPCDFAKHHT